MIYQSHSARSSRAITEIGIITLDSESRNVFTRPLVAFGADVTCCQDACTGIETLAFALPIRQAAQLIAVMLVDAEIQGAVHNASLTHGVDQCRMEVRKWHR